jgi:rhamnulokinase
MPAEIRGFCEKTGQPAPQERGALARCILESLALKCRFQLDRLQKIAGGQTDVLHMVGGGIQNKLLCQMVASATQIPVVAGPVEATAAGNIIVQLMATGQIRSIAEGRELVRRSFPMEQYEPQEPDAWAEAYSRFLNIVQET